MINGRNKAPEQNFSRHDYKSEIQIYSAKVFCWEMGLTLGDDGASFLGEEQILLLKPFKLLGAEKHDISIHCQSINHLPWICEEFSPC